MPTIKRWNDFQHYKSGRGAPPWIKLYRRLLEDPQWFALSPGAAKFLINCWLIASENSGELPASNVLAFRLRITEQKVREFLGECDKHFIINDDSNLLADCYQLAIPETETETETEKNNMSGSPRTKTNGNHSEALKILEFLNEKTGRHYRPGKANIQMIEARLKEGATVAECRQVIAKKCREWSTDEKMIEYLRPATLFNRTKFAQYQGELGVENDRMP